MSNSQSKRKAPATQPSPSRRRSERLSNRDSAYIDSESDDADTEKHEDANDSGWQPEPSPGSTDLTPAHNLVARGTQLSAKGKKRVLRAATKAETGEQCPLTNYSGYTVQFSHIIPRATANDPEMVSSYYQIVEFISVLSDTPAGMVLGMLCRHLKSRH